MEKMRLLLILIVIYLNNKIIPKEDMLIKELLKDENGIINIDAKDINYFIKEMPRNYDIIIYLNKEKKCSFCNEIYESIKPVAKVYKKKQSYYALKKKNGEFLRPIFFFNLNYDENSKIFFKKDLKLNSLPAVYYSQVEELLINNHLEKQKYIKTNLWRITRDDGVIVTEILLNWINSKTKRNIEIKPSMKTYLTLLIILLSILIVFYILFSKFYHIIINTKVWYFCALLAYFVCSSGIIFCGRHGRPLFEVEHGEFKYFSGDKQYILEGFLASGIYLSIGFIFLFLVNYLKKKRVEIKFHNFLFIFYNIISIIGLIFLIENFISSKNYYNPIFLPPDYFIKGSLKNSQGKSI